MKSLRVATCIVAALYLVQGQVASQRYCATLSSDEASGASGWYNMQINAEGDGQHTLELDLSEFTALPGSCDLSGGLTYHIHTYWSYTDGRLSGDNSDCGYAFTGNHYDPYLACGPNTEESTLCSAMGRTASSVPPFTYPCTSDAYGDGNYEYCEVGDTSGKFGRLFATDPDMDLFSVNVFDPSPALIPAYDTDSLLAHQWSSVVVHCGSSRILCAKFLPISDSAECGSFDTSVEDDDSLDFLDLTQTEGALLWTGIIIVGTMLGFFVGYKLLHSTPESDNVSLVR